jgi:DNA-binding transcriptional LysR family regulator
LLPHAERALHEVEQARLRVEEVHGLKRGRLSIGVLTSVAAHVLPRFVAQFRRAHPGVEVVIREETISGAIEDTVHSGELDLGIVRLPKRRVDLEQKFLLRERLVVLVPLDHRLAKRQAVSIAELAQEPFVTMKAGTGLRQLLDQIALRAGFEPNVVFETAQISSMIGSVLAGIGITIVPEMAAGTDGRKIPVRDREAYRELGVVWRPGQSLAAAPRSFLDLLRDSPVAGHSRT